MYVYFAIFSDVGPYDIALIKLKSPLTLTSAVQAVKLPKAESEPSGNATLCGWGSTSSSRIPNMPNKLQHINLTYIDIATCSDAIKRLTGSSPVHETNICTGPLTGGTSACSVSCKFSVNYNFFTIYSNTKMSYLFNFNTLLG